MQDNSIPYIAYESAIASSERHIKRLWIALIICIAMLFASNSVWLWAWMQYDYGYESVEIETEDGNANYIGNDGDITNGKN